MGFENKVVMITGGAQGIGAAAAQAFAEKGAAIVIADLDAKLGEALANELNAAGGRALAVECDVADTPRSKTVCRGHGPRSARSISSSTVPPCITSPGASRP